MLEVHYIPIDGSVVFVPFLQSKRTGKGEDGKGYKNDMNGGL